MIAEPYICTKGQRAGEIASMLSPKSLCSGSCSEPCVHCGWQRYADFEREKLKELGLSGVQYSSNGRAYEIGEHCSVMIGYASHEYENDTESGRLLKRAKFLKYVCEKEGVEWLPKEKCKCEGMKSYHAPIGECCEGVCPCPCHQEEKEPKPECEHEFEQYEDRRDYYTKEEEREFRADLLRSLELEAKFKPAKIPKIREGWIESLREKYL